MKRIIITVDGSCTPNPGTMKAGIVLAYGSHRKEFGVVLGEGTNQRAELLAAVEGLLALNEKAIGKEVILRTDSQYVWGLCEKAYKAKANQALVDKLRGLVRMYKVTVVRMSDTDPDISKAHDLAYNATEGR